MTAEREQIERYPAGMLRNNDTRMHTGEQLLRMQVIDERLAELPKTPATAASWDALPKDPRTVGVEDVSDEQLGSLYGGRMDVPEAGRGEARRRGSPSCCGSPPDRGRSGESTALLGATCTAPRSSSLNVAGWRWPMSYWAATIGPCQS